MHGKCEVIANSLQMAQRPDWYEQLSSQDTPKAGGPNQSAAGIYANRESSARLGMEDNDAQSRNTKKTRRKTRRRRFGEKKLNEEGLELRICFLALGSRAYRTCCKAYSCVLGKCMTGAYSHA